MSCIAITQKVPNPAGLTTNVAFVVRIVRDTYEPTTVSHADLTYYIRSEVAALYNESIS